MRRAFSFFAFRLQMPVPRDVVVVLEQERFYHRGQLHVEIEEIDDEGPCEQQEQDPQNLKNDLERL